MPSPAERVQQLIRRRGILRSRDLAAHRIPREYLSRLLAEGAVQRPTRGIYVLADATPTENQWAKKGTQGRSDAACVPFLNSRR